MVSGTCYETRSFDRRFGGRCGNGYGMEGGTHGKQEDCTEFRSGWEVSGFVPGGRGRVPDGIKTHLQSSSVLFVHPRSPDLVFHPVVLRLEQKIVLILT